MRLHRYLLPRATLLLLGVLLAGCGLKGKLYLPEPEEKTPPVEHNKADPITEGDRVNRQNTGSE